MIFQLLEDLTEMSTMRNCKDIFGYIESKQDILGKVCASILVSHFPLFLKFYHLTELYYANTTHFSLATSFHSYLIYGSLTARAVCSRKTCHVKDLQSTPSSPVKGSWIIFVTSFLHILVIWNWLEFSSLWNWFFSLVYSLDKLTLKWDHAPNVIVQ